MSKEIQQKQICVVVPTYNPDAAFLQETLDSIAEQTLAKNLYELVIVDDCSDDPDSLAYIESLSDSNNYRNVSLRIIRHDKNRWLVQARTTGAQSSNCPFVVFLDDDDRLSPDYLQKCFLLISASPEVDWVYTNILKFGQQNSLARADGIKFLNIFFKNGMAYSSLFRRDTWLKVGQREIRMKSGKRLFEDWDMYIRLLSKGYLGTPLSDTTFHYRKTAKGLLSRTTREYIISMYANYRMHFWSLPFFPVHYIKYRRFIRKGYSRLSLLHPVRYVNLAFSSILSSTMKLNEVPSIFDSRTILLALFRPEKFQDHVLNDASTMSLALMRSGFDSSPDMTFARRHDFPIKRDKKIILAGHIWWQMGGAENIFLEWIKTGYRAGADKIIDMVAETDDKLDVLQPNFDLHADEQYAMDRFGETPYQRLRSIWNLICLEQPRLIYISSNSYLYYLAPHIKREFPDIKIIDILHNEYDGVIDWFSISADFNDFIDCRIVTSNFWKELLINKYGVEDSKIAVTRNPVDTDLYDPDKFDAKTIRRSYKLHPNKKVISFIGRLHHQKGLDTFLALAELMSGDEDFQFVIVGDGELRQTVIDKLKTQNNISYLGYFSTVEKILAMTDVLVCPSRYEGAPLIGLEAASMNTALIAPDIVGFREQIAEGKFGMLYQASMLVQQDADQIRQLLLKNLDELKLLAKNGRTFAQEKHSIPVTSKTYAELLAGFLG